MLVCFESKLFEAFSCPKISKKKYIIRIFVIEDSSRTIYNFRSGYFVVLLLLKIVLETL